MNEQDRFHYELTEEEQLEIAKNNDSNNDNKWSIAFIVIVLILAVASLLSGCSTIPQGERGYVTQVHSTVFGLYMPIFDFVGNNSPTKVVMGYINTDIQITPEGETAMLDKTYEGVLGDNIIHTTLQAGTLYEAK